jgi:hypothetical protein
MERRGGQDRPQPYFGKQYLSDCLLAFSLLHFSVSGFKISLKGELVSGLLVRQAL